MNKQQPPKSQPAEERVADRTTPFWVIALLVIITIIVVVITEPLRIQDDQMKNISKGICENLKLIYQNYDSANKEVVCVTNVTYIQPNMNITPEQVIVRVKPDWDFYLNKTGDKK